MDLQGNNPTWEEQVVSKLLNGIKGAGKLQRNPNKKKWIGEIRKLFQEVPYNKEYIEGVMDWYIIQLENPGKYLPRAYSMTAFRAKFMQILDARNRDATLSEVIITRNAETIITECERYHWPAGSMKYVPQVVQHSLNNYEQFRIKLSALCIKLRKKPKKIILTDDIYDLYTFAIYVNSSLSNTTDFVLGWMRSIWASISYQKKWDGNLCEKVFTINAPEFNRTMYNWSNNWGGSGKLWDTLRDKLRDDV